MKTVLLIILSILFSFKYVNAQNIKVSQPYKSVKDMYRAYIEQGDEVLALKSNGKTAYFQKINKETLKLSSEKNIALPKSTYSFENVVFLNNKYYALYTVIDKHTLHLYAGEIDFKAGNINQELKKIASHNRVVESENTTTDYVANVSFKQNKLYFGSNMFRHLTQFDIKVLNNELSIIHSGNRSVTITHFDENLKKTWKKTIEELPSKLNGKNIKIRVRDYNIDKEGNLYISTLSTSGKWSVEEMIVELCKIDPNGKTSLVQVSSPKGRIQELWLQKTQEGDLNYIIAYSEGEKYHLTGVGTGKIENSKAVYGDTEAISPSFYSSPNFAGNQINSLSTYSLELKKVFDDKDGSKLCFLEFQYINIGGNLVNIKDQLALKINSDQSISWIKGLPRNHQSPFTKMCYSYSSYIDMDNYHYLFFLDAPNANNKYEPNVPAKKYSANNQKGCLTYYKINRETGTVSKKQLFNKDEVNGTPLIAIFAQNITKIDASTVLLEAETKGKKEVFIKIELE